VNRPRARALALVAAGAVVFGTALTGLVAGSAKADSTPGSGFLFLGLFSEAGGERVIFTDAATHQGEGFAEEDVPYSHAELNTSKGYALTSAAWPGTAVGNIGALLVLLGAGPQAAPLNDPVRAEARSNTGPPTVRVDYPNSATPAITMSAKATPTDVVATSAMGGSRNVTVGAFGNTSATSTAKITGVNSAESTAESVAKNLSVGPAGLVSIGSVVSTAHVTTNGQSALGSGGTSISNMKVAGFPVTVDQNGVHAKGQGPSAAAANSQINKALVQTQTQIFFTQPTQTSSLTGTSYDAGCLFMSFGNGQVLVLVGGARAVAGSSLSTPFSPPGIPPPFTGPTAPAAGGTTPTLPTGTGGLTPSGGGQLPVTAPEQPTPQLAANSVRLPGGALAPGWLVAALLGAGLIAFGLWRLPDRLLEQVQTSCPLGED
jgi:hypothetical protein